VFSLTFIALEIHVTEKNINSRTKFYYCWTQILDFRIWCIHVSFSILLQHS